MKILVICDDLWHPAEVIQKGMSLIASDKYEFDFVMAAKDILTEKMISSYPVIINCKGNSITAANNDPWFEPGVTEVGPTEFKKYVENGGGFISLHAGNTFRTDNCKEFVEFIGNAFVTHPPRCEVTNYPCMEHPITKGVEAFTERDEHYELDIQAKDITPILKSESKTGGIQIAGYTRNIGKGRLCVLTPGHTLAMWENKNFQKLLMQAVEWCKQ